LKNVEIPALGEWEALTRAQQVDFGERLAARATRDLAFLGLRPVSFGARERDAAFLSFGGRKFVFVPRANAFLGFDAARWTPSKMELQSWRSSAEEYGISETISDHVDRVTTKLRPFSFPPMLVEVEPVELGWRAPRKNEPAVERALDTARKSGAGVHFFSDGSNKEVRVTRESDGRLKAEVGEEISHATHCAELARDGMRLPTFDEWEYLCGAGAPTLFRWGDHAPCNRYPTDLSPAEAEWNRRWALSGGRLEPPETQFERDWIQHVVPNAHGLLIARNPYNVELVAEPNVYRGGDCGASICGGVGFFLGWLTLASAYFDTQASRYEADSDLYPGFVFARRVLDLS
jgi:hypothetical protein